MSYLSRQRPIVRSQLPNGARVRAHRHRVYRTPSGMHTGNPHVARDVKAKFIKRVVPASYSVQRPPNLGSGSPWVQLSAGDAHLGTLHVPGRPARNVTVLQAQRLAGGDVRAQVRYVLQNPWPWKRRRRRDTISAACRWDVHSQQWVGPPGECPQAAQASRPRFVVSTHVGPQLRNPADRPGFFTRMADETKRTVRRLVRGDAELAFDTKGIRIVPKRRAA